MSAEAAIATHHPVAFSLRTFGFGMAGVCALGAALAAFLWLNAPDTIAAREQKLASQTVLIKYEEIILSGEESPPEIFGPPAPQPEDQHTTTTTVIESPVEHHEAEPAETAAPATAQETVATLARAPIDGLYEDTKDGRLPKIRASDKLTPFDAYRRPFTTTAGKPVISIAIIGMGISASATEAAIQSFPPDVTLVMDPYAINPDFWINEARADGHEIWLHLPVETNSYPLHDPGPQTLLVNGLERQNLNKLNWVLSRGAGYAGLVTGYDSSFTKSANALRPVASAIYMRGLGFIDGDTQPDQTMESMAESMNRPYAHNNVWIDIPATAEHVSTSLRQLEVLAQGQGSAIGFVHATPMSIEMLNKWIGTLNAKGLTLAPLSVQANPIK